MKMIKISRKRIVIFLIVISLLSLITAVWFIYRTALSPIVPHNVSNLKETIETKVDNTIDKPIIASEKVELFDKSKFSNTDPSSIWVVVNKSNPLKPTDFIPNDLISTVGATISSKARFDFESMNNAALADGVNFTIVSSYRSYAYQSGLYNNYVANYGQEMTDTFSARPGYSEHQTGLAIDLGSSTSTSCNFESCFSTTVEGKWLENHAYEYGFLLRYTAEKQQITGYKSEPWHFRFIGRELASEMNKKSISTMEEFFDISGGEVYI